MRVRISRQAWNDLLDVKAHTLERYGFAQLEEYESLVEQALETIARNPEAGQQRPELLSGVRSCHIGRRGRHARHLFFYRVGTDGTIEIIRFLHDAMDFVRHFPSES